jgi:hypothetical protein
MCLLEVDPDGNPRTPKGWVNHPAVRMWRGYETALCVYILEMVREWKRRGYKSTLEKKLKDTMKHAGLAFSMDTWITDESLTPEWMRDLETVKLVTRTHRIALLNKNYEHYSDFEWPEDAGVQPTSYEYYWPVEEKEKVKV